MTPTSVTLSGQDLKANRALLRQRAYGIVAAIVGTSAVFGLSIAMNGAVAPRHVEEKTGGVRFDAPPPPPPKKANRPKPKPKKRQARRSAKASAPRLGASLSGLAFDIPALNVDTALGDSPEVIGDRGNVVMTEDTVDVAPRPRSRVAPTYPKKARKLGIEGRVVFNLLVDDIGRVARVVVLESVPSGVFDDVAEKAVRKFTFEPGQYKGKAVRAWARQAMRFELERS